MSKKFNLLSLGVVYICFMTVYMTVREVLPLNFLIDSTLVSAAVFVPGFVLIVWDLLTKKNCLNGTAQDLLILFLIVCCVSSVINLRFGIFGNVKFLATLVIEYFIFFSLTKNASSDQVTKILNVVSATLIVTWFIPVLVSLLTYFFGIDISVNNYGAYAITSQGFSYEYVRLWGIFQDPNYASIISLVSVMASVRLIAQKKHWLVTILLAFNMLCQLCYIVLGGSRTALILSVVAGFLFAVYRFVFNGKKKSLAQSFKGLGAALLSFVVFTAVLFGTKIALPYAKAALFPGKTPMAAGVASLYDGLYSLSGIDFELTQRTPEGDLMFTEEPETPEDPTTPPSTGTTTPIDRTDLGKNDISNGRFIRWTQTLDIFMKAPLFGTSPRNLSAFAKVHNPETLMAKYGIAPHNGYLDVLVETGIVGFGVLAIAVMWMLFSAIKRFLKRGFSYDRAFLLVSVLCFAGLAVFVSDVYMTFTINSMFFWLFLGMAHNLDTEPKENGVVFTVYSKTVGKLIHKLFNKKGSV